MSAAPPLIALMGLKVSGFYDKECDVGIIFDELKVEEGVEYEPGLDKWIGDITLPGHEGNATHGMVFMVVGMTLRFKQTIAYHFTGDSTDGTVYGPIIIDLIKALTAIGLRVRFVSSDMGSPNLAFWK